MTGETTFIGIDLAWQSNKNHTGIAVLGEGDHGLELMGYSTNVTTLQGVVDYVCAHTTGNAVVAIDAPLIIRNRDGQRPCETEIGRRFGKFQASAHSPNLNRYPHAGSMKLV
jgi:predicted RNase H-like nuclease